MKDGRRQGIVSPWDDYHDEILLVQPLLHIWRHGEGRVLDVGCGDGRSLHLFNHLGIDGFGLDIEPKGNPVIKGTATDLPFKNGTFTAVVCLRTLQHIEDHRRALKEIRRILKPGGHLILAVANARSYTMVSLKSRGEWRGRERIPYEWFRPYTEDEIRILLKSEGFEIAESEIVGFVPEILNRRFPTISKLVLRTIRYMEDILRSLPLIGDMGTHIRVLARIPKTSSSVSELKS